MATSSDKISLVSDANGTNFFNFLKKKLKILFLIIGAIVIILMYKTPKNFIIPDDSAQQIIDPSSIPPDKKFYILFWSHFFNNHVWYAEQDGNVGENLLKSINCPVTNCQFTHNRNAVASITDFDAIIIHVAEVITELPTERSSNQLYIFFSLEAPTSLFFNLKPYQNYFNLTATYRMDSDFEWDYGKIFDINTNAVVAPSKSPAWKTPDENFFDESYLKVYQGKTKPIAWFVSNCQAFSKRQKLVQKMQQYIDIDVYGRCGNLSCSGPQCEQMLTTTYMFYLSFENSLCKDYVTEKLFRSLHQLSIPIVYNGVKDMTLFTPPKSVINVNDYDTVEELVKYLKFLMANPKEYIKYFWWKKHYTASEHPYAYTHCNTCKKLNDMNFMAQRHQYDDINSWARDSMCNQSDHRIQF